MTQSRTELPPRPEEIVDNLAFVVSQVPAEVVFFTYITPDGRVADSECLTSRSRSKAELPLDAVLGCALDEGATSVMVTSRAACPLGTIAESDQAFTEALLLEGAVQGVAIHDHVLVFEGAHRSLRKTTDLWPEVG